MNDADLFFCSGGSDRLRDAFRKPCLLASGLSIFALLACRRLTSRCRKL